METDLLNKVQSFHLLSAEENGFKLTEDDIQLSSEKCSRSLIGKLYGEKMANFTGLKNTLSLLWTSVQPFKIREMGLNLFQFVFQSRLDQ